MSLYLQHLLLDQVESTNKEKRQAAITDLFQFATQGKLVSTKEQLDAIVQANRLLLVGPGHFKL